MAEKRLQLFGIRCDDSEHTLLKSAGGSPWAREVLLKEAKTRASGGGGAVPPDRTTPLEVHHIDDLGPDGLRLDNGAMRA